MMKWKKNKVGVLSEVRGGLVFGEQREEGVLVEVGRKEGGGVRVVEMRDGRAVMEEMDGAEEQMKGRRDGGQRKSGRKGGRKMKGGQKKGGQKKGEQKTAGGDGRSGGDVSGAAGGRDGLDRSEEGQSWRGRIRAFLAAATTLMCCCFNKSAQVAPAPEVGADVLVAER